MPNTEKTKGILSLVVLTFGFGLIAIFGRYLTGVATPLQQLYLSYGIGFVSTLFVFPPTLTLKRLRSIPRRDWMVMLLRVIFGYLIGGTMYRASLGLTKISNVTFIQSIPFAAIFGFILFKEKVTNLKVILILLSFLGATLISVKDFASLGIIGKGELFSLVSSAIFALSYLSRKWQTDFLNDKEISQIILLLGFLILGGTSWLLGEKLTTALWTNSSYISLLGSGLFNAINIFLINYGFRRVESVMASNILTLEAVFALGMAYIFFREIPNFRELAGGLLIAYSVIALNHAEAKRSV